MDTSKNELPTFKLMKSKLTKSLERNKKILNLITKLYPNKIVKNFIYKVKITKKKIYQDDTKKIYFNITIYES